MMKKDPTEWRKKVTAWKNGTPTSELFNIPKYDGGINGNNYDTENPLDTEKQIDWMRNWLKARRDVLEKNADAVGYGYSKYTPKNTTGDVRDAGWNVKMYDNLWNPFAYFNDSTPTRNRINKIIYSQIENAQNVPKTSVGVGVSDDYNMRGVYVEPDYLDNSGNYVAFAGVPDPDVIVHELTHASHPEQQERYILNNIFDGRVPQVVPLKRNTDLQNAKELYGALQQFRYENKLDPKYKVTQEWINKNRNLFKGTYLENIKDQDKLKLFNDVAQNNINTKRLYYADKGKSIKPLPKYDGGTDSKTYLPEYEYEATVTPQGTSLEKHKRITNEEDWQKYWGNVGAGYVNQAQESVAKPILEVLKTASYFTPLGNATAFGDLLAANINGDKDEVLASAAELLPQVRWARNAYKTGKQLMSLNHLWDRHYIHALNDKDLRGVKNLRDAHFIVNAPNTKIKNGDLPVTLYHGTPNKGWNEYDPKFFGSNTDDGYYGKGLYLTETLDDALAYARIKDRNFEKFTGTKNPYLKRLYVNSETPFVSGALNNDFKIATANEASDRAMLAPHFGRDLKFKIGTPGSESGTVYIPNDMIYDPTLVRELENADASIFSNVLHHVDRDPTIVKFDEVIVPKSSQMKYVDPITHDDFGNVIPLSMRDNFSNPDFRFDKGRSIHINPANKGKFNATKKRTGKTTEQLAHSKNPLTRRRAIFALNSRKFKH